MRFIEISRTPFTYKTILRDLLARQCTLNAGAQHIRELTALYSSMIAADGRDLKLESGSLSSVLRWEKTCEVLCLLIEGQQLPLCIVYLLVENQAIFPKARPA